MKVFYAGVFERNADWGAESFLRKAFHDLQHTTYCLDYRSNRRRLFRYFLDAPECDLFFLQRGDFFPSTLVKAVQIPRLFWGTELPGRCRDHQHLIRSGLFDHCFFWTSSIIDLFVERGWVERDRCSVLAGACEPTVHKPLPGVSKDIDVLFVGSMTARRQQLLSKLGREFNTMTVAAFGSQMVQLFNQAKIVLNIHADDFLTTESRVFEALGCGAFLLTEKLAADSPFSAGELVQFDSHTDLAEKIRYYLAHDEQREEIARCGRAAVLDGHTYAHRAQKIMDVASGCRGAEALKPAPMVKRSLAFRTYGLLEPVLYAGHQLLSRGRQLASR